MALDKSALLAARNNVQTVEIPGVGSVVVRGLTRKEALTINGQEMDEAEAECRLLSFGLVEPAMTDDEIRDWQAVALAGELSNVVKTILEISGMTAEAPKEVVKGFRG